MYDENQRIKESYGKESELVRNENNQLKSKMKTMEKERLEDM